MRITKDPRCRGFTMVELMVVIAIIVLLLSLATGGMFTLIVSAREAATATTIAKVHQILQERVAGFRLMDFTDSATQFQASWNINYPINTIPVEAAEVVVRKFRMKTSFPQNLTEVYSQLGLSQGVINPRFAALSGLTAGTNPYESGIVLYALLTNGETFGTASVPVDTFSSSEVLTSAATGNLPCLVDAWGQPLRFYRWPTQLIRTGAPTANAAGIDRTYAWLLMSNVGLNGYGADGLPGVNGAGPVGAYGSDDVPNVGPDGQAGVLGAGPLGAVGSDDYEPLNVDSDDSWLLLYNYYLNSGIVTPTTFEQGSTTMPPLHTPYTYHPFLIVSAGPDRQLGLGEPTDMTTGTTGTYGYLACPTWRQNLQAPTIQYLTDNITNLNRTSSGK